MTFHVFNLLTKDEQYNNLFKDGVFIEYYLQDNTRYALYALYGFFVELEYDVKANSIENLKSFVEGVVLDKYINIYIYQEFLLLFEN